MRIEDFLARHGITTNPFANAEEAQGDEVLMRVLEKKNYQFGHPQWPKFFGDPPGNQTSVVFGLKGSGKTAMRLALEFAINVHNKRHPNKRVLVVPYDDFNRYLDNWRTRVDQLKKNARGFWGKLFGKAAGKATLAEDWKLAHHVDAILSETTHKFEEMLAHENVDATKWDDHTKYDLLFLAAVYTPSSASDYTRKIEGLYHSLFPGGVRFKTSFWGWITAIATLGIAPLYRWIHANGLAHRFRDSVEVVERDIADLRWALQKLPLGYLESEPLLAKLVDRNNEASRYELLNKLVHVSRTAGYARVVVVIDKVDEPSMVHGNYDRISEFILPLWNNKLLQTSGVHFKMLLPAQLNRTIRKAHGDLLNTARLDKANMIYPFTWSGKHLHEILSERATACLSEQKNGEFDLHTLFAGDVSRDELVLELDRARIPRYAAKLMNRSLSEACENILSHEVAEGELPKISGRVFHRVATEIATEMRNDTQDLLEFE